MYLVECSGLIKVRMRGQSKDDVGEEVEVEERWRKALFSGRPGVGGWFVNRPVWHSIVNGTGLV